MKLSELKAKGGHLDLTAVKVNVTWRNLLTGDDAEDIAFDVYIIPDPVAIIAVQGLKDDRERMAQIVSKLVLLDDGREKVPLAEALTFESGLLVCLSNAALIEAGKKKSFPPLTNSGASLSLPASADGVLPKPSGESPTESC